MKELFNLPKEGVKALLKCSWITYLYHLVFLGIATFILFFYSLSTNASLGGYLGYMTVVAVTYVLLTSFLLRVLTGETGKKTTKKATTKKKESKKDTE